MPGFLILVKDSPEESRAQGQGREQVAGQAQKRSAKGKIGAATIHHPQPHEHFAHGLAAAGMENHKIICYQKNGQGQKNSQGKERQVDQAVKIKKNRLPE